MKVLSRASLGPADTVPRVPGFIESEFNPLAYAVGRACLSGAPFDGARTAVVLGSVLGDTTTTDLHCRRLAAGQVHNPLLFMQATPNAVLGTLTAEFAVTGPTVAVSAPGDPAAQLIDVALALLADGLSQVLVIAVELAAGDRGGAARDCAAAALLGAGGPGLPAEELHALVRLEPTTVNQGENRC
jgi:hypothetical protein